MIESSTPAMKGEKTKYRLAAAMKECMKTTPVDAITVRQITDRIHKCKSGHQRHNPAGHDPFHPKFP